MSRRAVLRHTLVHLNIVLAVFAGGMLVTGARLSLDPTLYVPLRALWPAQWRAATIALLVAATWQLVLVHIIVARRDAYCMYSVCAAGALVCEMVAAVWVYVGVRQWLQSPAADDARKLLRLAAQIVRLPAVLPELLPDLPPLADIRPMAPWLPEEGRLETLLQEIQSDLQKSLHITLFVCVVRAIAQLTCVLLSAALCRPRSVRLAHGKTVARVYYKR